MEEGSLTTAADIRERNRRCPARISPCRRRSACRCLLVSRAAAASTGINLYGYAYDTIGNRLWSAENAATNSYTANNLNQYTSILRASASLREITHDVDGNMLSDGDLTFTYDDANRLKTVSSNGVLLVTNFYDAKSRRVKKVTPEATTTFFYDGWNLIEERIAYTNGTSSTIRYFWGKDLSGTLQGAGGVGGLLYLTIDGAPFIPSYDNIGNIIRYLDANGNTVAQYTYGAFGGTISATGTMSNVFRHRFSTKYLDVETGFYYYGYRFYHPALMRWLNRDPIEEQDSENLFQFCLNSPTHRIDTLGLASANQWNYTYSENGKFFDPLKDFLDGGDSKTYRFIYPDSASQRLMEHPTIKALLDEYSRIKCGDSFQKSGNIQYTAKTSDYVSDVATSFGVKNPDGSLNEVNAQAGDLGYQVLGSFTVQYDMSLDCSTCTKRLFIRVKNTFSVESLFRNPFTRKPTITTPFLKPVSMVFDYDFEDSVR